MIYYLSKIHFKIFFYQFLNTEFLFLFRPQNCSTEKKTCHIYKSIPKQNDKRDLTLNPIRRFTYHRDSARAVTRALDTPHSQSPYSPAQTAAHSRHTLLCRAERSASSGTEWQPCSRPQWSTWRPTSICKRSRPTRFACSSSDWPKRWRLKCFKLKDTWNFIL